MLQGINLTVKSGEFLVVLGPSGAGKSMLLRQQCYCTGHGTVFDFKRASRRKPCKDRDAN